MLSKKDWLVQILIFCAEVNENKDYSILAGLPFELTLDNKIYRLASNKLLDEKPKLSIFKNDRSLFLHSDIIKVMEDAKKIPTTWLKPNLENYLIVLHEHIDGYDRKNKSWLRSLVSMIVKVDEKEFHDAIEKIKELEIVFQKDGEFGKLEILQDSPVLFSKEDIPNIDYLSKTEINLVHPEYIDIYKPLLKLNKFGLIKELDSRTLALHILYIPQEAYDFFEDKDTREYLIDLIAQDIMWIEEIDPTEEGYLNDIPFIATNSNNIYAKSTERKLFLPANFTPPKHIPNIKEEYEIISVVDKKQYALYKKMGFDDQDSINYLTQIIIPFIESSPSFSDIENIIKWLAKNW